MANCIAEATGYDTSRVKEVHRLGSEDASVRAATWATSALAHIHKDGTASVEIRRNGATLVFIKLDVPESETFEIAYDSLAQYRS